MFVLFSVTELVEGMISQGHFLVLLLEKVSVGSKGFLELYIFTQTIMLFSLWISGSPIWYMSVSGDIIKIFLQSVCLQWSHSLVSVSSALQV